MKLLPDLDTDNNEYQMSSGQAITLTIVIYISLTLYTIMLLLGIHNVYYYLLKQGKYNVYPLCLFYTLVMPNAIVRIVQNFTIVHTMAYFMMQAFIPAILKTCIGISQILILTELIIRIDQSMLLATGR